MTKKKRNYLELICVCGGCCTIYLCLGGTWVPAVTEKGFV